MEKMIRLIQSTWIFQKSLIQSFLPKTFWKTKLAQHESILLWQIMGQDKDEEGNKWSSVMAEGCHLRNLALGPVLRIVLINGLKSEVDWGY